MKTHLLHLHLLSDLPALGARMSVRIDNRESVYVSTVVTESGIYMTRVEGPWGTEHYTGNLSNEYAARRYWALI